MGKGERPNFPPVRILGHDPGFAHLGFCRMNYWVDWGTDLVACYYIGTKKSKTKERVKTDDKRRLGEIRDQFMVILGDSDVDVAAFEECPSVIKNPRATRTIGQAWGGCWMLATLDEGVLSFEYGPKQLKKAITNRVSAPKELMIEELSVRYPELRAFINHEPKYKHEHVADAVAAAVTAAQDPAVRNLSMSLRRSALRV